MRELPRRAVALVRGCAPEVLPLAPLATRARWWSNRVRDGRTSRAGPRATRTDRAPVHAAAAHRLAHRRADGGGRAGGHAHLEPAAAGRRRDRHVRPAGPRHARERQRARPAPAAAERLRAALRAAAGADDPAPARARRQLALSSQGAAPARTAAAP